MDDLISRQAAIDALNKEIIKRRLLDDINDWMLDEFDTENILRKLPSAQPEQRWISCSEKLPEDDTEVIVSCTDDSGDSEFSYTTIGWHFKGIWVVCNERSYFVRAWMPLPEVWKGEQND